MKSATVREWMIFVVLVTVGAAGRWIFKDIPNFTPTAGIAVFAGLYFSAPALAFLAPVAVMVVSNVGLQGYGNWGMLAVVYAALLFPVLLSRLLSRTEGNRRRLRPLGMLGCGVLPLHVLFPAYKFCGLDRRRTVYTDTRGSGQLLRASHSVLSLHAHRRFAFRWSRAFKL